MLVVWPDSVVEEANLTRVVQPFGDLSDVDGRDDPLRSDPRFDALLQRMRFPD